MGIEFLGRSEVTAIFTDTDEPSVKIGNSYTYPESEEGICVGKVSAVIQESNLTSWLILVVIDENEEVNNYLNSLFPF